MPTRNSHLGQYGEQIAADHLRQKGYTIQQTNWHCQAGELDIVAQQGEMWVFIEVKTRRTHGTALTAITPAKRERIIHAVYAYLEAYELEDAIWRIDAMSVVVKAHQAPIVHHVEDALDW